MAHRCFKDQSGRLWDVWEVNPTMVERRSVRALQPPTVERRKRNEPRASLPQALREGWLAFECRSERRRLAPTPDGWEQFSDDQLVALLEQATMRGKTRRLIE